MFTCIPSLGGVEFGGSTISSVLGALFGLLSKLHVAVPVFFRYNWSPAIITQEVNVAQTTSGCEYIPMVWGEKDMTDTRLSYLDSLGSASHLLGFNEPNFGAQV